MGILARLRAGLAAVAAPPPATREAKLPAPFTPAPPASPDRLAAFYGLAVEFHAPVKHGALHFAPGVPTAFEDPDAAPYFVKAGWAAYSDRDVEQLWPLSSVDIDPGTDMSGTIARIG